MTEPPALRGIPASPGVAKGVVRVVHGAQDAERFHEGDVLVTEMTEPAMVVMMNRAAAIITDTGGLTCHAAIVSRELGIPCVVATKQATSALHDGDRVSVDGASGEVHILHKA